MINIDCKTDFINYQEKIRTIFSTPYILKCYSQDNFNLYREVYSIPQIKKLLDNKEIIETSTHFLNNDLNLTQAAKCSFMHRNTMIYRLNKIAKITGLNIKKFEDAQLFSNFLIIKNILEK